MKILNFIKIVARASTAFIFISLLTIQSGYAVEETHSLIAKSGVLSGVVVHVGLTDINVARSIPQEKSFLFYGLTTKPELVSSLRSSIRKAGMDTHAHVRLMKSYGKLPFAENLVNLVIADLDSPSGAGLSLEEIMRVITPSPMGAAFIKKDGKWKLHSKLRDKTMGDWRPHRNDPNGNMYSQDGAPIPSGFKWITGPMATILGRKDSTLAMVSAAGRNFYVTRNV